MRTLFAKVVSIGLFLAIFCITPYVGAAERVAIPRSEEKEYCPVYYDTAFCSKSQGGSCVKGISVLLPTSTPTPTFTPTPTITNPTPTLTAIPLTFNDAKEIDSSATEVAKPASDKPDSLDSEKIFQMINAHRAGLGLAAFQKEDKLCTLAVERGPELYNEIFVTHNIHGGFYNRNIPFWITENMKYGDSEEAIFNWWLSSSIHRKAIEGDFLYSCGTCYGKSCAQLFTSYQPK